MRAGQRCRDVPAGASDVSTGRRMLLQRTDALNLRGPTLCIPSFNKRLCAVSAYVHFEKQRTHLVGASDMSTGRRMLLQRTDATEPPRASRCLPQKNLCAPPLCIPSFNKRLCAAPVSVHFEKQRTHLVGTSLHPPAGRQLQSGIRRQRQKPRCVQDGNAGGGDVGTYRQVRPTCQPAGGCIYKERIP